MLRFKQFLLEDMPLIDWDSQKAHHREAGDHYLNNELKKQASRTKRYGFEEPTHIGNIGPYRVHKQRQVTEYGGNRRHTVYNFTVSHRNKKVGLVRFSERANATVGDIEFPRHITSEDLPRFLRSHSGGRSLVRDLPARVYELASNHLNVPIVSGSLHTLGGKNIWDNLAKTGSVSASNVDTREIIHRYNPDEHAGKVYDDENTRGANWSLIYKPKNQAPSVTSPE